MEQLKRLVIWMDYRRKTQPKILSLITENSVSQTIEEGQGKVEVMLDYFNSVLTHEPSLNQELTQERISLNWPLTTDLLLAPSTSDRKIDMMWLTTPKHCKTNYTNLLTTLS